VSETKSSQFTLTFEEEGKENVTHTFEALNPQEACTLFFYFYFCFFSCCSCYDASNHTTCLFVASS